MNNHSASNAWALLLLSEQGQVINLPFPGKTPWSSPVLSSSPTGQPGSDLSFSV